MPKETETERIAAEQAAHEQHLRETEGPKLPAPVLESAAVFDTNASGAMAAAKARIESAYSVAIARPRDIDVCRTRLLKDCKRPGFAEGAWYQKPIGKGKTIDGLSVRFAESVVRTMGNLDVDVVTTYDDDEKRILTVRVTDLEVNGIFTKSVTVSKSVERRRVRDGQHVIRTRTNSYGDVLHVIEATPDEVETKAAAMISKAVRTEVLRFLPADIAEECVVAIQKTIADRDAADPDAAKKRIFDAFALRGIEADRIKAYLGHAIEETTPAELVDLRSKLTAIQDGEATWGDFVTEKREGEKADRQSAAKETVAAKAEKTKGATGDLPL